MSESGVTTPTTAEPPASPGAAGAAPDAAAAALDDRDLEPRTPMKRLGSTRKLAAFTNIRMQLCEQSRALEARAEASAGVAAELHEYCRRRAELEHDYARALDKLARAAAQRHKDQRHKREQWQHCGAAACLQQALDGTRALAKEHAALGELYGGALAARLQRAADDALRLHRRARDVLLERHDELGAALAEAGAAGKACAAAAAAWRAAAAKLRLAYDQRERVAAADPPRPKKLKALDKELDKRRTRHSEARARALRARADYVLSLEAANATLQRYYLDDIAEIMMCMEVGFEAVVGRAVREAAAAEGARAARAAAAAGALRAAAGALDALADRQRFVDAHAAAFALPRPQTFQGVPPERQDAEVAELVGGAVEDEEAARAAAAGELRARLAQLEAGARSLRAELREAAKTLDAAEAELVRQMEAAPEDEAPRRDQEDYYLHKFRAYVACAGRLARLEGRAAAARARVPGAPPPPLSPPPRARSRRGQFAAPLGDRLPLVLTSCVRVIATYGLRHQGIFRVSGSQVEMQALRAAFERGEDPLAAVRDAADINCVCGLLKMYLRELRPPLLPPALQESLLRTAALPDGEFVRRMRDTLAALPAPALLVLRYLFAFLAHLAQHSAHNMMDAWNLAICLGPTLLAAWGEGGAQVAAQNLANELVKRTIVHHAAVFPQDVAPHQLYRPPPPDAPAAPAAPTAPDAPDAPAAPDAHVAPDDLSLYDDNDDDDDDDEVDDDDDDDDDEDEMSEDGESGEWQEGAPADSHRAASVERGQPESPPPEQAGGGEARLAGSTPDLVLGLPPGEGGGGAADHFAHNRDTLRKRRGAPASPVPARNTARVAAKFADLTLTGGSLKPALAAKPALLRRPTPHPARASAPAPAPAAAPALAPAPAAAPAPDDAG